MGAWYVTREEVSSAPDIKASAYAAPQLDRAIESGARRVERTLHRIFYPWTGTKRWDYPLAADARSGVLWLDDQEIISLTSLTAGEVSIPLSSVLMEPVNSGPPYHSLVLNRDTSAAFSGGQQGIVAVGVFGGCALDEISVGTLTAGINASVTTLPLTTSPGVGSILRVDSERMIVTEKLWVSSGQTGSLA
ncbi:MAG TPA: hypothetical protein VN764_11055, partial [Polyangiaceae bacterium]|nr:hypothetical protein [Polyangiaceae bacterium]